MKKVILVDTSGLAVPTIKVVDRLKKTRAIEQTNSFILPARVMYLNSLLSCLKKIGVNKDDIVIMALEGKSWRKWIDSEYKAQRQGLRDNDKFTDWKYEFEQLNALHEELDNSTNWHFLRVADGLEADDIIAISTRFFKDYECIVVTGDKDLHMLAYYPNVKIFSATQKCHGSKGSYVKVKNPLKILADKSRLGDASDNIIARPTDTEEDCKIRHQLVNLLKLPEDIEEKGIDALKTALCVEKELHLENLPSFKNLQTKFLEIYNTDKIVTYDYCINLQEKRLAKKTKKKKESALTKSK